MEEAHASYIDIWLSVASAAQRYFAFRREGAESRPEACGMRQQVLERLSALIAAAEELDRSRPAWRLHRYVMAADGMRRACQVSEEKLEAWRREHPATF